MKEFGQLHRIYDLSPSQFTPLDMIKEDYYNDYLNNSTHPFKLARR